MLHAGRYRRVYVWGARCPFIDATVNPIRIDFIFIRGKGVRVKASKVVFNGTETDFVSDHSAVLTEITRNVDRASGITAPGKLSLGKGK